MSRARRIALILLAVIVGLPVLVVICWLVFRPTPPPGAPRIGLSMASSFVVQRPTYKAALARAGGQPVLLTPVDDEAHARAMLETVDALLLAGGSDVDPALYGGEAGDEDQYDRRRDDFEIRLIDEAIKRDMPILGVCRGIQILNVAYGGSIQNLRDDEARGPRHGIGTSSFTAHEVTLARETNLAGILGAGTRQVNSFHGQAVDRIGDGLVVCAVANDDIVEAIERPGRSMVIGVQWHPEIASLTDADALALFEALVARADAYRQSRATTPGAGGRAAAE